VGGGDPHPHARTPPPTCKPRGRCLGLLCVTFCPFFLLGRSFHSPHLKSVWCFIFPPVFTSLTSFSSTFQARNSELSPIIDNTCSRKPVMGPPQKPFTVFCHLIFLSLKNIHFVFFIFGVVSICVVHSERKGCFVEMHMSPPPPRVSIFLSK